MVERFTPSEVLLKSFLIPEFDNVNDMENGLIKCVKVLGNRDAKVLFYVAEPIIIRLRDVIITQPRSINPHPNQYVNRKNLLINSAVSYCRQVKIKFRSIDNDQDWRRVYSRVCFGKIHNNEDLIIEMI